MINSATPDWLVYISALASVGIATTVAAICARLVCVPATSRATVPVPSAG